MQDTTNTTNTNGSILTTPTRTLRPRRPRPPAPPSRHLWVANVPFMADDAFLALFPYCSPVRACVMRNHSSPTLPGYAFLTYASVDSASKALANYNGTTILLPDGSRLRVRMEFSTSSAPAPAPSTAPATPLPTPPLRCPPSRAFCPLGLASADSVALDLANGFTEVYDNNLFNLDLNLLHSAPVAPAGIAGGHFGISDYTFSGLTNFTHN